MILKKTHSNNADFGLKKHLLLLSMLKIVLLLIIFVEIVKHVSEFFEEENI